jgi:hypothetical protein
MNARNGTSLSKGDDAVTKEDSLSLSLSLSVFRLLLCHGKARTAQAGAAAESTDPPVKSTELCAVLMIADGSGGGTDVDAHVCLLLLA